MSNKVSCLASAVAGATLVMLFAIVAVIAVPAAPASATAPSSCYAHSNGDDYGNMSSREYYVGGGVEFDLGGIRTSIPIHGNFDCSKIFSVYIYKQGDSAFMEFGYALGWISCFGGAASTYSYHANPTLFAVAIDADYNPHCKIWSSSSHPVPGNTNVFRASDANSDGKWGGWWAGNEMQPGSQGWNLGFIQGDGGTNAERSSSSDAIGINFNNIDEFRPGTGLWSATDNMKGDYDHDPGYHWVVDAPDHLHIAKD